MVSYVLTQASKEAPALERLKQEILADDKLTGPEVGRVLSALLEENMVHAGMPRAEIQQVLSDKTLGRGEAIGILAAFGNSPPARRLAPLTKDEVDKMASIMARFGLDPEKPEEARMIRGLARFEKCITQAMNSKPVDIDKIMKDTFDKIPRPIGNAPIPSSGPS
jgi:hypothetical protein